MLLQVSCFPQLLRIDPMRTKSGHLQPAHLQLICCSWQAFLLPWHLQPHPPTQRQFLKFQASFVLSFVASSTNILRFNVFTWRFGVIDEMNTLTPAILIKINSAPIILAEDLYQELAQYSFWA